MIRTIMTGLLMGSGLLMATSVTALTASQTVEREVSVRNADGSETVRREPATMVTPGEKIVYSLNYHNDQEQGADNIVLVMPVPTEVDYIEGSAERTGVNTAYSVDGGQSYAQRSALKVRLDDGGTRMAKAEDITHIRWNVNETIAPGSDGILLFKGVLK